jgi:hypothetical protein
MMKELAMCLKNNTDKKYDWKKQKIKFVYSLTGSFQILTADSCLAHVINLTTQMLISTYSNSPHFDLKQPDVHIPTSRDEVGLVRAIVVKVRSFVWLRCDIAHHGPGMFISKVESNVENNSN